MLVIWRQKSRCALANAAQPSVTTVSQACRVLSLMQRIRNAWGVYMYTQRITVVAQGCECSGRCAPHPSRYLCKGVL